jgi:exopolysaccharide biosynthesis polyprenyl glycosylphosphotransferase
VIVSLAVWAIFVASTLTETHIPDAFLVGLWAAVIGVVLAARAIARSVARRRPRFLQNTLIVGAGDVGQLLGRKVTQHPELGLRLVGFVDDDPKTMRRDLTEVPILGSADEIRELVDRHDIQRIIVSFSNDPHRSQLDLVEAVRDLDVRIDLVPRLFEAMMGPTVDMHHVEGLPLVSLPTSRSSRVARAAKRAIDIVGSAFALLVLSPLLLLIAWRVKRDSAGPVFFRQERLGVDMTPFELLKFRTMRVGADDEPHRAYVESIMDTSEAPSENGLYKLSRPDDVTKAGQWLRKWSLDELPQLINVLRGDMSLVGPRPCLAYESEHFEDHHFDRFLVPAGMTGLWQVTARARTTFKEALDLDVAYARYWSLGLDFKLMLRTPFVLFRQRGTA